MLDILSQHLAQTSTPEFFASIASAFQTFERVGLENYENGFEELLMTDDLDVVQGASTTEAVLELTCELLRRVLGDHGVVATPEATCTQLNDLVNALLDLQTYSDFETITATASLDGEPNEVFAELVALVTPHQPQEVMVWLQDVSYFLLKRIRELAKRDPSPAEAAEQAERVAMHRGLLEKAVACAALSNQLDVTNAVRQGLSLGLPFFVYIQRFGYQLQFYSADRAGQELLAMAYASRDGWANPSGMVHEHVERYVSNMDTLTAIDVDVTNRLLKINQS